MSHILVGLLGVLVGAFLGNRFALDRDKRKEYNLAVIPMRETLIKQLQSLKSGNFKFGLEDTHLDQLRANLSEPDFKRIIKVYMVYDDYRSKSGKYNSWHEFIQNKEYFDKFTTQTETLLRELYLK